MKSTEDNYTRVNIVSRIGNVESSSVRSSACITAHCQARRLDEHSLMDTRRSNNFKSVTPLASLDAFAQITSSVSNMSSECNIAFNFVDAKHSVITNFWFITLICYLSVIIQSVYCLK